MLGIFKEKDVSQQVPPQSHAQRLDDARVTVKETQTQLLTANNDLETFARNHNLIFDELGAISNFQNCAIHWPPEVANEYTTLSERRNEALRAFHEALKKYADLV